MNIDYRKQFRESDNGKKFHQATSEGWFHDGVQVALQTFFLPGAANDADASANWFRQEGAKMFADMILNLTETPKPRTIHSRANLKPLP